MWPCIHLIISLHILITLIRLNIFKLHFRCDCINYFYFLSSVTYAYMHAHMHVHIKALTFSKRPLFCYSLTLFYFCSSFCILHISIYFHAFKYIGMGVRHAYVLKRVRYCWLLKLNWLCVRASRSFLPIYPHYIYTYIYIFSRCTLNRFDLSNRFLSFENILLHFYCT